MDLIGSVDRNLDAKGRLSIPAVYREAFGEKVVVLPAPEKEVDALYVFNPDAFEAWLGSIFEADGGFDPISRKHRVVKDTLIGRAHTLEIDSAARISLPEATRKKVGLNREVTVVASNDRLAIWDRATHEEREAANDEILADFFDR